MNRRLKFGVAVMAFVLYALPAKADIEAIQAAINVMLVKAEAVYKQVQDIKTEALKIKDLIRSKKIFPILKILKLTRKSWLKPPFWKA